MSGEKLVGTALVAGALEDVVRTLRETAEAVDAEEEFPSLTIDQCARDGYVHACHDIADAIERRSIAGGALKVVSS